MAKMHLGKGSGGIPVKIESVDSDATWEAQDGTSLNGIAIEVEGGQYPYHWTVSKDAKGGVQPTSNAGCLLLRLKDLGYDTEDPDFDTEELVGVCMRLEKEEVGENRGKKHFKRKIWLPQSIIEEEEYEDFKKAVAAKKEKAAEKDDDSDEDDDTSDDEAPKAAIVKAIKGLGKNATKAKVFAALQKAGHSKVVDNFPALIKGLKEDGMVKKVDDVYVLLAADDDEDEKPAAKEKVAKSKKDEAADDEDEGDDEKEEDEE